MFSSLLNKQKKNLYQLIIDIIKVSYYSGYSFKMLIVIKNSQVPFDIYVLQKD